MGFAGGGVAGDDYELGGEVSWGGLWKEKEAGEGLDWGEDKLASGGGRRWKFFLLRAVSTSLQQLNVVTLAM